MRYPMQNNIGCIHFVQLYHCNVHYKNVVKHANVGHKFVYVFLALSPCVLIRKYVAGLDLSLGLEVLAWFNITGEY